MCLKKKSKLLSQFGAEIYEFKVGRVLFFQNTILLGMGMH